MRASLAAASLAAIALLALSSCAPLIAPAVAQEQCTPVSIIAAQIVQAKIPSDQVHVTKDVGFINDYLKVVGLGVPDGSEPIAIILVGMGNRAVVALVEPGDCVIYTAQVPIDKHEQSLAQASKGV